MPKRLVIFLFLCLGHGVLVAQTPAVGDVIVNAPAGSSNVRFTIKTMGGFVGFNVPAIWEVVAMGSKPPVAVAAFFVPEPHAKSSNATNVSISLISPGTEQGKAALERVGKAYEGSVQTYSKNGWECFAQTAHQKSVLYTILDAKMSIADVVASVRLAWPQRAKNAAESDEAMKLTFDSLLESISGSGGAYPVQKGDVIRHPTE